MRLPDENIYGHTKKLNYILNAVKKYIVQNPSKKEYKILDFGCGNGIAVTQFLINLHPKINLVGIDIHKESLEFARSKFGCDRARFVDDISLGFTEYDIIIYADIIEHLSNPYTILKSHYNLLSSSGIVIGSIPNGYGPFEIEKKLDSVFKISKTLSFVKRIIKLFLLSKESSLYYNVSLIPYNNESGHVQFFTKKRILTLLSKVGYKVIDFSNGAFIGALLTERLIRIPFLIELNVKVPDYLPHFLVSTWYFTCVKGYSNI